MFIAGAYRPQPGPYERSLWPANNGRLIRFVTEVSEAKAISMRRELAAAFQAAAESKSARDIEVALALSRSMQGIYYRDQSGALRRNFPRTTKRGRR